MRIAREKGVPHRNCGKLIAATNAEEDAMLAGIKRRAEANGVEGMRVLTAAEAIALEPNLHCTSALLSPSTGIIDSHAFMLALQGDAENAGAVCGVPQPGAAWARGVGGGIEIDVGGAEPIIVALPAAGELGRAARAGAGAADRRACRPTACRARTTPRATILPLPDARRSRG